MIILNYNDYVCTENYINKIKNYKQLDKLIIVDNNSTDNSFEKLMYLKSDKADVIKTNENKGYAYGNNFGIKYAEKKYNPKVIIISNPDIIIDEYDLERILLEIKSDKDLAISTGIICKEDGSISSNIGYKLPKYKDVIKSCSLIAYKISRKILKTSIYYSIEDFENKNKLYVDVVPGCFFAIKSEVMRKIGYFDEDTFLYCEEEILAKKLKKLDYKSCVIKDAKVIHYGERSTSKAFKRNKLKKELINRDSKRVYLKKYLNSTSLELLFYDVAFWLGQIEKLILIPTYNYVNKRSIKK